MLLPRLQSLVRKFRNQQDLQLPANRLLGVEWSEDILYLHPIRYPSYLFLELFFLQEHLDHTTRLARLVPGQLARLVLVPGQLARLVVAVKPTPPGQSEPAGAVLQSALSYQSGPVETEAALQSALSHQDTGSSKPLYPAELAETEAALQSALSHQDTGSSKPLYPAEPVDTRYLLQPQ
jgi:hypothetical protein